MNKIFFLIVFLSASAAMQAQDTVFTVKVFENKQLTEKKSFGINGNLLGHSTRLNDDPELWFYEYMFYDNGHLARSEHFTDKSDMTVFTYTYNDRNKLQKKTESRAGSVVGETEYFYNNNGWIVKEITNSGNRKQITTNYEYTLTGLVNMRSETIVDSSKTMILAELYEYNADGKINRMIGLNGSDTIYDFHYTYDKFGFKLRQDVISHGDTTLTIEWVYGKNGSYPMLEKHLSDGLVVRKTKTAFNREGRKKKETVTEYRIFSGKMKPEKTVRKFRYDWND
ncbi:hypothetical protein SDC9_44745 [bioreactor metagenome]|uniref:Uncharacterized protein n=1 Tax=bioreactor metagenome TaxID=1076179 RepID=A0A644W470_9ZZZZ